jgi:hypothetical protein
VQKHISVLGNELVRKVEKSSVTIQDTDLSDRGFRSQKCRKIFICTVSLRAIIIFMFIYVYIFKFRNTSQVISFVLNTPPRGFPWELLWRRLKESERERETAKEHVQRHRISSCTYVSSLTSTFFPPSLRQDFSQTSDTNAWAFSIKFNYAEYGRRWAIRSDGHRHHLQWGTKGRTLSSDTIRFLDSKSEPRILVSVTFFKFWKFLSPARLHLWISLH